MATENSNPFKNEDVVKNEENIDNTEETSQEEVNDNEEVVDNKQENNELQEKYDKLNQQYIRLAADFDNYRKRQEQERESLVKYGTENALKKMLEVLDNFDKICSDLGIGLPAEIEARQKQYEYYRNKLLSFKEKKVD